MLPAYSRISLTLVLALTLTSSLDACSKGGNAWAAPSQEVEIRPGETKDTAPPESSFRVQDKNLSITEPVEDQPQSAKPRSTFYPYKQSMSPRMGVLLDPSLIRDSGAFPMLFGIAYMLPRNRSPQIEVSFDLLTNSQAHFTAALRRVFYERQSFRPYLRAGITAVADADEKLATFSDLESYLARFGIGLEDVISLPMSVRFEIELAAGTKDQMALLSFGYSWGW